MGRTFGGHPVASAAGVAAMDAYGGDDGLISRGRAVAPHFEDRLRGLADANDAVGDVRGRGLLWAIELADRATGEPFVDPRVDDADNPVTDVIESARDQGVLLGAGRPATQVIVAPPLVVDEGDVDAGIDTLGDAVAAVFG